MDNTATSVTDGRNVENQSDLSRAIAHRVKRSGSSFYWAMRLMPPQKRHAMYAVYAYCREVDDIADGELPISEKIDKLNNWRAEIELLYAGQPNSEIGKALLAPLRTFEFSKQDFMDVIDGMEMDAVPSLQLADMDELMLYCDRVACSVGRLSNRVFGFDPELSQDLAKSLGEALQLTNILRDVHEDSLRRHIYLPADLLRRHGVLDDTPDMIVQHPNVEQVCLEIAEITAERYREAGILLEKCGHKQARPAKIMKDVYFAIFGSLQQRGWRHLDTSPKISKARKLFIVLKAAYLQ